VRILLAGTVTPNRTSLTALLSESGFAADFESVRDPALARWDDSPHAPQLLIWSDPPGVEAVESLIRELCARQVHTAVLVAVAHCPWKLAAMYLRAGAADVIRETTWADLPLALERSLNLRLAWLNHLKQTDQEQHREELWRQGFLAARIAVWNWDIALDSLVYSENLGSLYGLSHDEFSRGAPVGLDWFEKLIVPEDFAQMTSLLQNAIDRRKPFHVEIRARLPDGNLRWLMLRGSVTLDAAGNAVQVHGITTDIDERKRAQLALQDSEQRFRDFMDNSQFVAFIKDYNGYYTYVNRNFRKLLFADSPPIVGQHDDDIYAPEVARDLRTRDLQIWRCRELWSGLEEVPLADGRLRRWWVVKFIFANSNGEEFLGGMAIDMTERFEAEEQARTLHEELAHLSRLATIGQLVSELAHELNQPLYAAGNYAEACVNLLQQPVWDLAELRDWLGQTTQQIRRMGLIIRRVGGFGSKEAPVPEPCKLNELLQECCKLLELRLRKETAKLIYDLADDLPLVLAQPLHLQQVLINLISNALDALADIPPEQRQVILRTRRFDQQRVLVEVVDNGSGIAPELLPRIFDPFYTTKPEGVGLGLAISRSIIKASGGELLAEPNHPTGMVFRIILPIQRQGTDDES